MRVEFTDVLWFWRGPAPWYFVTVPEPVAEQIRELSGSLSYGWGMIPAGVEIGGTRWSTALWPKDGSYVVPIRADVRRREHLDEGDDVTVGLSLEI